MKERDIIHHAGPFWVGKTTKPASYTVYKSGITHSTADSSYEPDANGRSIAIARCNYLGRNH